MVADHGKLFIDHVAHHIAARGSARRPTIMSNIDVLITTALELEHDAARDAALRTNGRAYGIETWEKCDWSSTVPYLRGTYVDESGGSMVVALARPTRQGATATMPIAATLIERLNPRCLAMCGVCAGNPSAVALGDVIIAEMTYLYDEGKVKPEGFEGDHRQIPMLDTWVRAAQDLKPDGLPSFGPAIDEPKYWLLERLYSGDDPTKHPARDRYFPGHTWGERITEYINNGLVRRQKTSILLTKKGLSVVEEHLLRIASNSPPQLPFQIKVGPMASGNVVVKDGLTWPRLAQLGVRTVLGLDMEAAAIGALAHRSNIREWVVVKGVMDHADPRKDDRYKAFAARNSAEVLFRFVSRQLGSRVAESTGSGDLSHDARAARTPGANTSKGPGKEASARDHLGDAQNVARPYLLRAIRNIAELGDTDVCPYPPEKHIFYLRERDALAALTALHDDASNLLKIRPPAHETLLCQIGYTGFRWVTQLDPLWNAYFLGLCLSIGNQVEQARIATYERAVFSYRFRYDDTTQQMFDPLTGWPEFITRSRELASEHAYIVKCDIADFYHRIHHERLVDALESCGVAPDVLERIRNFLSTCSSGPAVGLPVGGPAARLLAEALLNQIDHVLRDKGIPFCRFADDYHLFAPSLDSAYSRLILLSELLQKNGMTLQKLKTRILTQKEFLSSTGTVERLGSSDDEEIARFLTIKVRYDPYAPNARENYNRLAQEMKSFDILGMLSREMAKSRVNELVTRRLTKAVRFLDPAARNSAIKKLIARDKAGILAPVFPAVLVLVRDIFEDLEEEVKEHVFSELCWLYDQAAPILRLDLNIAFWIRILARAPNSHMALARKQCVRLYDERTSKLVRRDAILAMADLRGNSWLSTLLAKYDEKSLWERRALIAVSHLLGAEGHAWRQAMVPRFDEVGRLHAVWGTLVQLEGGTFIS
jgi:nucleoside phosphorylase